MFLYFVLYCSHFCHRCQLSTVAKTSGSRDVTSASKPSDSVSINDGVSEGGLFSSWKTLQASPNTFRLLSGLGHRDKLLIFSPTAHCHHFKALLVSARIREKVEGGISSQKCSREARFFSHPPSTLLSPPEGGIIKVEGGMTNFWNRPYVSLHYTLLFIWSSRLCMVWTHDIFLTR